ncbi:MAG: SEC-C domain-containing protein [Clostridia bacterium]|nr:SEC-C domain-containing protein [Clostridia bacterium]
MSKVYKTWVEWGNSWPTEQERQAFYDAYWAQEAEVYAVLLQELIDSGEPFRGSEQEMAEHYGMKPETFAAFLDGINESLKEPVDLDELEETTEISWEIVPEKLYYNMVAAKAHWLYDLPQWDSLLSSEERRHLMFQCRQDQQVHVDKRPGRNDPCPCGSGKKYKKCCMRKDEQAQQAG